MAEELEHEPQPQEPRTELPEEGAAPADGAEPEKKEKKPCLLYTSPSPRD